MSIDSPRHASEHDCGREDVVAGVGEELFKRCEGKDEKIGHDVEAECNGGEIDGEKAVQEIACRVVVGSGERVRHVDAVMPGPMQPSQDSARGRVHVLVDVVLEHLIAHL